MWRALTPLLTNGESYFWRDRGRFALLRREIIPALLRARPDRLRIWSAGCSSGQEAYSLAMLLDECLPAHKRPHLSIVGTDLNEAALEKARRAVYGEWSFRGVPDEMRARHFERVESGWRVREHLRAMLSFRALNLAAPVGRGEGALRNFDLVLCRNVLIYLAPQAVANAVGLLSGALREGGFLLAGHAELANRELFGLTPQLWPESVIYRKSDRRFCCSACDGTHEKWRANGGATAIQRRKYKRRRDRKQRRDRKLTARPQTTAQIQATARTKESPVRAPQSASRQVSVSPDLGAGEPWERAHALADAGDSRRRRQRLPRAH